MVYSKLCGVRKQNSKYDALSSDFFNHKVTLETTRNIRDSHYLTCSIFSISIRVDFTED